MSMASKDIVVKHNKLSSERIPTVFFFSRCRSHYHCQAVWLGNLHVRINREEGVEKPLPTLIHCLHKGERKTEKATEDRRWLSTFSNSGTKSSDWYTVTFRTLARKSIQSAYREGWPVWLDGIYLGDSQATWISPSAILHRLSVSVGQRRCGALVAPPPAYHEFHGFAQRIWTETRRPEFDRALWSRSCRMLTRLCC